MLSQERVEELLRIIESDDRLHYPVASAIVNLPLALIQTDLKARASAFRAVLELPQRLYHGKD